MIWRSHFHHLAPENQSYYTHTMEGSDDMPAHIKASLLGHHVSIPITDGQWNFRDLARRLLREHRNNGGKRTIIATFLGTKLVTILFFDPLTIKLFLIDSKNFVYLSSYSGCSKIISSTYVSN